MDPSTLLGMGTWVEHGHGMIEVTHKLPISRVGTEPQAELVPESTLEHYKLYNRQRSILAVE